MAPEVRSVNPRSPEPSVIRYAAEVLRKGGLVALPTETVYGIACLASSREALSRLRALKERPPEEPFPLQVATVEEAVRLVGRVPVRAKPLIKKFWPGPLTIVFPEAELNLGGKGLGIRVPAHPVAAGVLKEVAQPIACPSCNPRSEPPAVSAEEVLKYFPAELDLVLDGGTSAIRQASTVVRVEDRTYEILREGLLSREMVAKLLDGKTYLFVCTGNTCRSPMAQVIAEGLFRRALGVTRKELRALGFRFLSAGTFAAQGLPASANARKVVAELGFELKNHRSRPLTPELIRGADYVLCMEESHLRRVLELAPEAAGKAKLLAGYDVPDPIGGDEGVYRTVRDTIKEAVEKLLP